MQSFREYIVTNEAMTMATRMKMKAAFRKNKVKIAIGRKKAAKKLASPEKLKQRAQKQAYAQTDGKPNVLIDDYIKNIKEWEDKGGIGIHHTAVPKTLNELKRLGFK